MPTISFLILTYNSKAYIKDLFDSFFSVCGKKIENYAYEVVIVDNASTDDTQGEIRSYFEKRENIFDIISKKTTFHKPVRFFESRENLGYAKGINLASKFAQGEVLIIINPDGQLLTSNFDRVSHEFENHKKMAVAGLSIKDYSGKYEKNAGKFYNPVTFFLFALGFESIISTRFAPKIACRVDYVSGGFVAIRKSVFESLNGYDDDYFMYVEDMDLCLRASKAGHEVWYLPVATFKHEGQGSSNKEFAIVNIYRGLQIFYTKHKSTLEKRYITSLLSLKATLIIFVGAIFGKKELVNTYTKALEALK